MKTQCRKKWPFWVLIYAMNLGFFLYAAAGNMILGLFGILLFRLTLWLSPIALIAVAWVPVKPRASVWTSVLIMVLSLVVEGVFYGMFYWLTGTFF